MKRGKDQSSSPRANVRIEDMRLFAKVAESKTFTAAAQLLGMPKQTLSRRVAELERALDVVLLHRTTRRLHLTEAGAAYADRCAEMVRLAEEANHAITDDAEVPKGVLRVTADPLFGETFLAPLIIAYAKRWPAVHVDVMLTQRRVDLVEEGVDVAFRVGVVDESQLSAVKLGPARVRYCASPAYVARRGAPKTPKQLASHDCVLVHAEGGSVKWPFRGARGIELLPVSGRLRFNSFAMARSAALAGLGIAIFPEFACAEDVRRKRLVPVLEDWLVDVGAVWLLYPARRYLTARVRTFVDLARESLERDPPWASREARHTRK